MRSFSNGRLLGATSLLLAASAACSPSSAIAPGLGGGTLPATGITSTRAFGPAADTAKQRQSPLKRKQKALLYVADAANDQILVFDQTTKKSPLPKYAITQGISVPDGITTDTSGNLYVANGFNNTLTIYKPGKKTPAKTITTGMNDPVDVAVDSGGNIFVANDPFYSGAYINEYPKAATSPSYTWYPPQNSHLTISSLALLSPNSPGESSIYAAYYTLNSSNLASGSIMDCYPGDSSCFNVGYSFGQTGGIAVEESPNEPSAPFDFLLVDQYIPGFDNIVNNTQITPFTTGGQPEFLALNSDRTELFVSNMGTVTEYGYPGFNVVNTYHSNGASFFGVAVTPAGTYF